MKRALFLLLSLTVLAGLSGCVHDQMCCPAHGQRVAGLLPGSCASCPETCDACAGDQTTLLSGCGCGACDPGHLCGRPLLCRRNMASDPGPPIGAVTYPYYTVHGPRDFLASDPRPIGP